MKIKITPSVLSIPPYVSTAWKNISLLQIKGGQLSITLYSGTVIEVPSLDRSSLDAIFEAHALYGDKDKNPLLSQYSFSLPLSFEPGFDAGGGLLSAMGHNPEQAHLEPLPAEVLQKIAAVTKAFGLEDKALISPGEPHCNCLFCQVVRALHGEKSAEEREEIVAEEDLQFRSWDIQQTTDNIYELTNPLDSAEKYQVFLGEPLGCTCGHKNCEHLRAVLSS